MNINSRKNKSEFIPYEYIGTSKVFGNRWGVFVTAEVNYGLENLQQHKMVQVSQLKNLTT